MLRSLCRPGHRIAAGLAATTHEPRQHFLGTEVSAPPSLSSSPSSTFRYADLQEDLVPESTAGRATGSAAFGESFTDHMLVIEHSAGTGWGPPLVKPFGPLSVHPAAPGLHYGMGCFEGMKAYMGPAGQGLLFRPDMNMARFQRSCARLCLAPFDWHELLECIKHLLRADKPHLPSTPGHSLYIRPFAFAASHTLGVSVPSRTVVSVILSPVGPYFASGLKPVSIFIDEVNVRAWPGGVGSVKVASNYAPTVQVQVKAQSSHGCAQVLYVLPAPAQGGLAADPLAARLSECGTMNMFFVFKLPKGGVELATPRLDDTLLPGVTRDSVLRIAESIPGLTVSERDITLREVRRHAKDETLIEAFGTGTACIVQPVTCFKRGGAHAEELHTLHGPDHPKSWAMRIKTTLEEMQTGRVPTPWSVPFDTTD